MHWQLRVRRASGWIVFFVGLAGGPLTLLGFYLARLPGYHGVCVGLFGDTMPCTFSEFANAEASKLVFGFPIAIGWLIIFLIAYLISVFASPTTTLRSDGTP
ncbi:hypothetical protein [Hyphomicrobium sp. D-2]|uniref:hypothetical protein n=1 Tax=Hyphomicrobium sp. D-2 TaxID=3041621 RepID=UPI002454E3B2|nr:hypothetical protein [Hyphomicrobium sp. D-2]MDH4982495.1 hypothetical protein [Hyphomicrobium sp. D-2]